MGGKIKHMRFQVPQFIDIEDKIFGPLSFKQFVYIIGGGGIIAIFFFFLPTFLAIILSLPVAILSGALAFYKINNRPFIYILEAAIKHYLSNNLYIWKKKENQSYFSESSLSRSEGATTQSLKDKSFMLGLEKESGEEEGPDEENAQEDTKKDDKKEK